MAKEFIGSLYASAADILSLMAAKLHVVLQSLAAVFGLTLLGNAMRPLKNHYVIRKINDNDCVEFVRGTVGDSMEQAWSLLIGYKKKKNSRFWEWDKNRYIRQGYFCEEVRLKPDF